MEDKSWPSVDNNSTLASVYDNIASKYDEYRPHYMPEIFDHIPLDLSQTKCIVEIGAGTGIFSELLVNKCSKETTIILVEPLAKMRDILNKKFGEKENVLIRNGTASNMAFIESNSVNAIICAQSFHWFANNSTLNEFNRILHPKNSIIIAIWQNENFQYSTLINKTNKLFDEISNLVERLSFQFAQNVNKNESRRELGEESTKRISVHAKSFDNISKGVKHVFDGPNKNKLFGKFSDKIIRNSHSVEYNADSLANCALTWSLFASQTKDTQNMIKNLFKEAFVKEFGTTDAVVNISMDTVITWIEHGAIEPAMIKSML